jgi:cobalt-zinc-cadmium efflux system membrane fusion protein
LIDVPPENKAAISAYFGGYVKKLSLLEGQYVNQGQVLFTLENPEYVEIQQDFLETKGQLAYLRSDYERQKNLVQDSVTSQKIYLKAESDYQVTLVRYESLKKKLNLMNLDPDLLTASNIRSEINLTAPISGTISQIHASRGMYLNPDDIALTIINADHIHLELNIFEKDLPAVKKGQEIRFKLQNDPYKEYEAEVHLVGNYIDPERRSASIHGHLEDEGQAALFTPGMYIEAEILCDVDTLRALPQSAVVSYDNKDYVLIFKGNQDGNFLFEKREVKIGRGNEEYAEILNASDFSANDEFLIEGAFNLIGE